MPTKKSEDLRSNTAGFFPKKITQAAGGSKLPREQYIFFL
jgi:hypothetical protein